MLSWQPRRCTHPLPVLALLSCGEATMQANLVRSPSYGLFEGGRQTSWWYVQIQFNSIQFHSYFTTDRVRDSEEKLHNATWRALCPLRVWQQQRLTGKYSQKVKLHRWKNSRMNRENDGEQRRRQRCICFYVYLITIMLMICIYIKFILHKWGVLRRKATHGNWTSPRPPLMCKQQGDIDTQTDTW